MITLKRAVRIKEAVNLPSGASIMVDCNVEERLPEIISAYSKAVDLADKARMNPQEWREDFYTAYGDFLSVVIGSDNWKQMLAEFDEHTAEMCEAIAPWVNDTVTKAIAEASNRRLERIKHTSIFKLPIKKERKP